MRAIQGLREKEGNFSCRRIMQEAGISVKDVSVRTVSRFLNSQGYYYLSARKKGVLTVTDMKKRLQFARRMRKDYGTRANLLKFPARCADVLCRENLFPVVARKLEKQATERQITRESYSEFEERVINTFYSIPIGTINKLISSMSSRILKLIAVKGGRIKY